MPMILSKKALSTTKVHVRRNKAPKPIGHPQQRAKLAAPLTLATSFVTFAHEAHAHDSVQAIEAQMVQIADVPTPLLYFGFLTSSLTFAAGAYIALSKVKLI